MSISPSARASAPICPASQSVGQPLVPRDVAEHPGAQLGVRVVRQLAEVGDLAGLPQPPHHPPALRQAADLGLARQRGQRLEVRGVVAVHQAGPGGGAVRLASSASTA